MNATIVVDHDPRLLELFAPEDKEMPRGKYSVSETEDAVVFTAEAEDAVALRALLNAITKTLSLWERTEDL